jgi:hypothetical protein
MDQLAPPTRGPDSLRLNILVDDWLDLHWLDDIRVELRVWRLAWPMME